MNLPLLKLPDALRDRRRRRNVRALTQYLVLVAIIVVAYSALFQLIMVRVEGQEHGWVTAVYWTLTTMTTLGLGDIVFHTELGRFFTAAVLVSGIFLIFVVLPYAFIQFFYTPWLEARTVPERMSRHVIIARWDNIAPALVDKLDLQGLPYFVLESDPDRLANLRAEGVSATAGDIDDRAAYERLRVASASLVLANANDTTNTNVTLTVREVAPSVPIAAVADRHASVDILELAGATKVLDLKRQLGEQLANRMNAGHAEAHVIGSFRNLLIAEFAVHNTPFAGRKLREIDLRETLGANVIGVLEHAQFLPAGPDLRLTEHSYPVVVGTQQEIDALNEFLYIYDANFSPVLVIGGGNVGQAAAGMLKRKGVPVNIIERSERMRELIGDVPDRLLIGDAAERDVLMAAGLRDTPGVLLTTNDDAMNIYLAVYCRRLAPQVRIVSRITHDRNMEAIRRAGADLALSHTSLGVESVMAMLKHRPMVFLGEGIDLYELPLPDVLAGRTLADSRIAARTGLNVIAIQSGESLQTNPPASFTLEQGSSLLTMGSQEQVRTFRETYR